jgi:hypothetical protein
MANRHKSHKKAAGRYVAMNKNIPMDKEYRDVLSKSSHDRKGGRVKKKKFGGHAGGKKSHERMDKRARGGPVVSKLKSGGSSEWALSANSSKQPLTQASKVTSASK